MASLLCFGIRTDMPREEETRRQNFQLSTTKQVQHIEGTPSCKIHISYETALIREETHVRKMKGRETYKGSSQRQEEVAHNVSVDGPHLKEL